MHIINNLKENNMYVIVIQECDTRKISFVGPFITKQQATEYKELFSPHKQNDENTTASILELNCPANYNFTPQLWWELTLTQGILLCWVNQNSAVGPFATDSIPGALGFSNTHSIYQQHNHHAPSRALYECGPLHLPLAANTGVQPEQWLKLVLNVVESTNPVDK